MRSDIRTALLGVALAVPAPTAAQVIRWSELGQRDVYTVGLPVAVIADRDGDGFQDVAAVVEVCQPGGSCLYYSIWVFSGSDGRVLQRLPDFGYVARVRELVATADMNGDGVRDYAITIGYSLPYLLNVVEVRNGTDDSVLWSLSAIASPYFGLKLLGDIDLDGDGQPNLLVTLPQQCSDCSLIGAVDAYAPPGVRMYRVRPTGAGHYWSLGASIARVGDVDGDGGDDFVTTGGDPSFRGVAYLISGRTGREIRRVFGAQPGDFMGVASAGCDDLDGDGLPDFAVGAGGFGSRGVARVFSSATGQVIFDYRSNQAVFGDGFGSRIQADIDVDRDGIDDILIADPEADTGNPRAGGVIHAFSGRDGGPLWQLTFEHLGQSGAGYYLDTMPPQEGSPYPFIVATTVPSAPYDSIHLVSAALPGVESIGAACAGGLPRAPQMGIRNLNPNTTRLHLANAAADAPVAIVLGLSRAHLPLDGINMPGCALSNSAECVLVMRAGRSGLDAGYARFDIPLPLAVGAVGVALHGQWVTLGSGPVLSGGTSDSLRWRH